MLVLLYLRFISTDCIMILSGEQLLFMDPHLPQSESCCEVPLNRLSQILPLQDCLQLWGEYLNSQHILEGNFPGTIFWFPLRQIPSALSDTVYTHDHVEGLFESFSREAHLCLTFLKSLESISLKTITGLGDPQPVIRHQVQLTSPDMPQIQQKRRDFRHQLQQCNGHPSRPLMCNYEVTIRSNEGSRVEEQKMHILHYLPSTDGSSTQSSRGEHGSKHMPLVGVAGPTTLNPTPWSHGHIFCFLPLPQEPDNSTHLPIQVNGFFALDQNRRHVKWRTEESNDEPDVSED